MSGRKQIEKSLNDILSLYQQSLTSKIYLEENDDSDLLMEVFAITPQIKRENRQYWGRELGMCWQRLVTELCSQTCSDFTPGLRIGSDELCDLIVGENAVDTKYRIGSGDSGTLKKFKAYARLLTEKGYKPVLLIVREDNLPAAIKACSSGGWKVLTGEETYNYIYNLTAFDFKQYLHARAKVYVVQR
ncbi:MAG: restriction endonuclease [Blastocatellia bacterium]